MNTSTAVTPYQERATQLTVPWRDWAGMCDFGQVMVESGLAPKHVRTWQAAVMIIQTGLELRIPPAQALAGIYYFEGKVTLSARLMVGIIKRDHGGDAIRVVKSTDKECTVAYKRRDAAEGGAYTWTIEQAQKAGLLNKDNWSKYPAAMLRARALSAVAAFEFADLIGGLLTPEEIGAPTIVTPDGDVVIDGDAYAASIKQAPVSNGTPHRSVNTTTGEVVQAAHTDQELFNQYAALVDEVAEATAIDFEVERPTTRAEIEGAIERLQSCRKAWVGEPYMTPDQAKRVKEQCARTGRPVPAKKLSVIGASYLINQLAILPEAVIVTPFDEDPR